MSFVKKYAAVIAFILMWELASRLGLVNPLFIPPFSGVLECIWELAADGVLLEHTLVSLQRAILGFAAAVAVSIPLGMLMAGWSRNIQLAVEPVVEVFSQTNPFILFHIILLFLGIGEVTKITVIAWTCTWPVAFSTYDGIRGIEPVVIQAAKAFGLKRRQLAIKILLPAAAPAIFTGIRMSAGYSFVLLIAAEMMGSSSGLGWLIINGQNAYQIKKVFAGVTVIAFFGLVIDLGLKALEGRFAFLEGKDSADKIIKGGAGTGFMS